MNAEPLGAARAAPPHPPALIRIDRVMALTQLSKSTIYKLVREGDFPEPIRLTLRASAWMEDEVFAWLEARRANRGLPGAKH